MNAGAAAATQAALRGAIVAAVAVVVITGVTILRPHWPDVSLVKRLVFVGGALAGSLLLNTSPLRILVAAALLGYIWPVTEKAK